MSAVGPRRRPAAGGYSRGDEKRLQIIEAAVRVFGEQGYERASTRQIALEAGVNPPALQYYFDSKDGLHQACAEHIISRFSETMDAACLAAEAVPPTDREGATEALCGMLRALADSLFGPLYNPSWSRFMARGQFEDTGSAYAAIKQKTMGRLHGNCLRLVSVATGAPADSMWLKMQTFSILGQLTAFHLSRANALGVLQWSDFGGERLEALKAQVCFQTRAILKAAAALGGEPPAGG